MQITPQTSLKYSVVECKIRTLLSIRQFSPPYGATIMHPNSSTGRSAILYSFSLLLVRSNFDVFTQMPHGTVLPHCSARVVVEERVQNDCIKMFCFVLYQNLQFVTASNAVLAICYCFLSVLVSAGAKAPGRFNQAGQVSGEGPDETQHLVLHVGVGRGANNPTL